MKKMFTGVFTALLLLSQVYGAGFSLYEFSASAPAMGGAVVAYPHDISTIFYNPGGLAFVDGMNFYGGMTLIKPTNKFIGAEPIFDNTTYEAVANVFTPIGIYFSNKFTDKLAAGIGITNPYGLGLEWEDDFPGNPISRYTDLKSFYISPVVSYLITENLSVGGGIDIVYSSVYLERYTRLDGIPYDLGKVVLEGDNGLSYGFSLGVMYKTEKYSMGFTYRHQVENEFEEGEADFTLFDTPARGLAESVLVDQNANTAITFPSNFMIGARYQISEKLGAEIDYGWYKWSVFDKLELEFEDPALNQEIYEGYEDSYQIRVGADYKYNQNLTLRAGYIYDKTPQPIESVSPLLPDNDRNDYSFGVGYRMGSMNFDLGYMLVDFGQRSTVEDGIGQNENGFDGEYSSIAHLFMFSFGYTFR